MSEQVSRRVSAAAMLLGFAALCVIIVLSVVESVGTDSTLYYAEQVKAGVNEPNMASIDRRLAEYLLGTREALEKDPPFNAREMAHMADCLRLFERLRKVRIALIPCAVLLSLGGMWLRPDRRRVRRCVWAAPLLVLLPLGAFAVYAAVDFDAAFTTFHHLLFDNDLWLLDPATDLLIRLCPESMFMSMGVRIAAYSLLGMPGMAGIVTAMTCFWPIKEGRTHAK